MILTIAQYIEALTNSDGRLRTLERFYVVRDETGVPVFAMPGHGLVDFEVMVGGDGLRERRITLRCPLHHDVHSALRLRAMRELGRGLQSRFFSEWRLLEREVIMFNIRGEAIEVDILARLTPAGEPFVDFLLRAEARGDIEVICAMERSFGELCEWADTVERQGIVMKRLLVDTDGTISVTGFSANDERQNIAEFLREAAKRQGGEGFTPASPRGSGEKKSSQYDISGETEIRCVRDGGGWMYVNRRGHPVIDAVWTAATPFREGRAEVETPTGKGLIDRTGRAVLEPVYEEIAWDDLWGVVAVMVEGRWSLVDRNGILLTAVPYDWLGECSEGMVLAVRAGKCGFVDVEGREVIPCVYDDASSFSEGCAVVSLGNDSFFIDSRGERI